MIKIKKKENKVNAVTVRLDDRLFAKVSRIAEENDVTISEVIRQVISDEPTLKTLNPYKMQNCLSCGKEKKIIIGKVRCKACERKQEREYRRQVLESSETQT